MSQDCHRPEKLGKVMEIEIGHEKLEKVRKKCKKIWNFEICSQFL